jgi:hypothetical protein
VRALREQDANFITRDRTYNPASTARPDRPLDDEKGGLQAIGNNQNLSLSIAHDGHERSRIDETKRSKPILTNLCVVLSPLLFKEKLL